MAAADQLGSLIDLITKVQGGESTTKQTTSGGKQTQQTQLSDAAVQEQIRRILSGSGGVRDIGGAARRSGLYNATSEDMLLGDLYSRAAAQGEIARAPTVVTTAPQTVTSKQETGGADIKTLLGTVAGAAVLNKALDLGGEAIGGGISNLLGFGGGTTGTTGSIPGLETSLSAGKDGFQLGGSFSEGTGGTSFSGDIFGTSAGLGLPGVEGPSSTIGETGGVRKNQEGDFDLVGSVGSALSGFFSGGGLGGLVGAITGGTGSSGGGSSGGSSSVGTVICTALMEKGELNEELYAASLAYLKKLNPLVKVGYHSWAIGVATKIRKGSKVATAICRPIARSRTGLLASNGSFWSHVKYPLGTITKFVGEPACWVIGWVLVNAALAADLHIHEGA